MADLTNLESKLADVLGLAAASQAATQSGRASSTPQKRQIPDPHGDMGREPRDAAPHARAAGTRRPTKRPSRRRANAAGSSA